MRGLRIGHRPVMIVSVRICDAADGAGGGALRVPLVQSGSVFYGSAPLCDGLAGTMLGLRSAGKEVQVGVMPLVGCPIRRLGIGGQRSWTAIEPRQDLGLSKGDLSAAEL